MLTGVAVSRSTKQCLVHRQRFDLPQVTHAVEEMSVDGGKVRLRTLKEEPIPGVWGGWPASSIEVHETPEILASKLPMAFIVIGQWSFQLSTPDTQYPTLRPSLLD